MIVPPSIIDNQKLTLKDFLNHYLAREDKQNLDIATAFFRIEAYGMVEPLFQRIKRFRLLLGKSPEVHSDQNLGTLLLQMIKEEVEHYPLDPEPASLVQRFIEFLKQDHVEVRLYEKQFLHGKAYITNQLTIVGSSNFTPAGLTANGELNLVGLESEAKYVREEWFNKFWEEATDFKQELIAILENSRFGSKEYTPYEVYMKALFELQRADIEAMEEAKDHSLLQPASRVKLTEFQEDAVHRVMSRMKKYGAAMVADSVGLGKTWIAKKVIEEFGFYKRKKFLIICPAQLRGMWEAEVKDLILSPFIVSQEELAQKDFLGKVKGVLKSGLKDVSLVVIDESHNFRNPLSNRWENCFALLEQIHNDNGMKPFVLLLTATPINNSIWDLYWQIMLMTLMNHTAFLKDGIDNVFQFFKKVEKQDNPELLGDILNEISIRRTRDYIKKNYPGATIHDKPIIFPERQLENVDYQLDAAFAGLYRSISRTISDELTMAYYRLLEYKKAESLTAEEEFALGRMVALAGIFRTILLKRLESSVEAFRTSVQKHIVFLETLLKYLENGKILTKKAFQKYIVNMDEETPEDIELVLQDFNKEVFRYDELVSDIKKDIHLFKDKLLKPVQNIHPGNDAKLLKLMELLNELLPKGKVVLFTYYADTLEYIYQFLESHELSKKFKLAKIHGGVSTNTRAKIVEDFMNGKIDAIFSTDVLSEGQNLQNAQFLINYDLHWNPTRMIQRAGRIDRIGSPFEKIFVYNFFPEQELEDLLRLVAILQSKIRDIDHSVGLDQTVLGEEVHPKVFGIIRRIKGKDSSIFEELEQEMFGGGEQFYQPLKDFISKYGTEPLKRMPLGIYSGLERGISGIFFYYRYETDYHFWYLYDLVNNKIIKNKSEILKYISCPPDEKRVIPDFFERVFEINKMIVSDIERVYKEHSLFEIENKMSPRNIGSSTEKFIRKILDEIDFLMNEYLFDFPEDEEMLKFWEGVKNQMLKMNLTKRRTSQLRRIWRKYEKGHNNWKKLIQDLYEFVNEKVIISEYSESQIKAFDKNKIELVVLEFIS